MSRPVISIVGNQIGGEDDGVPAGNGGDGFSLNHLGGFTAGPIAQVSFTQNTVTQNERRGVNIRLNGSGGTRDRENGNSIFDPIQLTISDNEISSNGEEGIYYRADSDVNQGRTVLLTNTFVANFLGTGNAANDRPQVPGFYDPNIGFAAPAFQALNVGSVNGNTAFLGTAADGETAYLNLNTVQNSCLLYTSPSPRDRTRSRMPSSA